MKKLLSMFTLCVLIAGCKQGGSEAASIPAGTTAFTVTSEKAPVSFTLNGIENPSLTLQRGKTYTFNINTPEHPFYIKDKQTPDTANAYSSGVTNNGTETGTVTFAVPPGAPDRLFYDCGVHNAMTGTITITN